MRYVLGALTIIGMTAVLGADVATGDIRQPTVSDFAICNREATRATTAGPITGPADPQQPVPAEAAPGDRRDSEPPPAAMAGPGYRTEAGRTDPTGTLLSRPDDPLLRGMAAEHADDEEYRAAYRTCMAHRVSSATGISGG